MLEAGGVPVAFDDSRPADENNPRGYYELAGGKIITMLAQAKFPLGQYRGRFIKITAYGLKFLPRDSYKIIYMDRNIEEVLDSREKMAGGTNRIEDRELLTKLNMQIIDLMASRGDMDYLIVRHSDIMSQPANELGRIAQFIGRELDTEASSKVVDSNLYRNRQRGSMLSQQGERAIQKDLVATGYLGERLSRSMVKSLVWRLIGIIILGGIAWAITRSWEETTIITVIFHVVRTFLYVLHERIWNRIEWGRIKVKGAIR
jgi:uncharacterized membrane protein